jgi:hypothetical protein
MRLTRGRRSDESGFVTAKHLWHDARRPDQERDAMNKIVREHYPVENLPADLREGLTEGSTVRVVVEVEGEFASGFATESRKPMSTEESFEMIRRYRKANPERVTSEEAVSRIRELRDEWDD